MRVSFKVPFYSVHGSVFGELGLGLQHHQKCLLCDQEEETINHLLVSCVFSRQFWFELLHKFELQTLAPQRVEPSFEVWWCRSNEIVADQDRQGLSSLIILGAWSLCNHRNRCVFDRASPTLQGILASVHEEAKLWGLAGVKGHSLVD